VVLFPPFSARQLHSH